MRTKYFMAYDNKLKRFTPHVRKGDYLYSLLTREKCTYVDFSLEGGDDERF